MHKVASLNSLWQFLLGLGEDPFDPLRHPTLRILSRFMSIEDHDDRPATETITITVSGQFVEHARRLATLFGYGPGELGELSNRWPGGGCRRSTRMTGKN
jgi:hypothetical protein